MNRRRIHGSAACSPGASRTVRNGRARKARPSSTEARWSRSDKASVTSGMSRAGKALTRAFQVPVGSMPRACCASRIARARSKTVPAAAAGSRSGRRWPAVCRGCRATSAGQRDASSSRTAARPPAVRRRARECAACRRHPRAYRDPSVVDGVVAFDENAMDGEQRDRKRREREEQPLGESLAGASRVPKRSVTTSTTAMPASGNSEGRHGHPGKPDQFGQRIDPMNETVAWHIEQACAGTRASLAGHVRRLPSGRMGSLP